MDYILFNRGKGGAFPWWWIVFLFPGRVSPWPAGLARRARRGAAEIDPARVEAVSRENFKKALTIS
jgi:hypothetical protein